MHSINKMLDAFDSVLQACVSLPVRKKKATRNSQEKIKLLQWRNFKNLMETFFLEGELGWCCHFGHRLCSNTAVPTQACRERPSSPQIICPDVILQQVTAWNLESNLLDSNPSLPFIIWETLRKLLKVCFVVGHSKFYFKYTVLTFSRHFFLRQGFIHILFLNSLLSFFLITGFNFVSPSFIVFYIFQTFAHFFLTGFSGTKIIYEILYLMIPKY